MIRQGDILLRKIDKPEINNLKRIDNVILGHGEATGHMHKIEGGATIYAESVEVAENFAMVGGEPIVLEVFDDTTLLHEEHSPVPIKRGWYEVIRQKEYQPERIRYVQD